MVQSFVKTLWKRIGEDEAFGLAAQCAYYFLLSMFPFLLFVMSLLAYLPISSRDVLALIHQYIPQNVSAGVEIYLRDVLEIKRGGALSFGLLFSLFSASAAMDAIVLAINKAYGLPDRRSFIHSRLLAIVLTVGMLVLIATVLLLSVFGHFIGDWMHEHVRVPLDQIMWWNVLRLVVNFVLVFIVLTALYYIAPNTCLGCKDVVIGAFFAAIAWQAVSWGFAYYVQQWGNFSATYGSLGGVIVLMTWFYLTAFIIILGGQINAISYNFKKNK
ncbi:YihY/virulence factor BrkB family protein [Paenibacillus hamazuiensis]|uniref:YihY/virulence factor BrkB family protein n=1 Tax=Paenibacillus hamazuiensis TaxID=2936508 RepID=UPI00200DA042|nr:YihY/virulence factor BrkB family protein [Paenibacillus hamazuiensis]